MPYLCVLSYVGTSNFSILLSATVRRSLQSGDFLVLTPCRISTYLSTWISWKIPKHNSFLIIYQKTLMKKFESNFLFFSFCLSQSWSNFIPSIFLMLTKLKEWYSFNLFNPHKVEGMKLLQSYEVNFYL